MFQLLVECTANQALSTFVSLFSCLRDFAAFSATSAETHASETIVGLSSELSYCEVKGSSIFSSPAGHFNICRPDSECHTIIDY